LEKEFKNVESLLEFVRQDAKSHHRFPVTFILITGLSAWKEVIDILKVGVDQTLYLSDLCDGIDVLPYLSLSEIKNWIQKKAGQKTLILPMAEYLRLHNNQWDLLRELAQWEWIGERKIYVPLLELSDIFYNEMKAITRYGVGELPDIPVLKGKGDIHVQITPFKVNLSTEQTIYINGIKDYLKVWEQGGNSCIHLVSQFAGFLKERTGNFRIQIFKNGFEVIKSRIKDTQLVDETWGHDSQWKWLSQQLHGEESIIGCFERLLNVRTCDVESLLSSWNKVNEDLKWLIWLYSKLECKGMNYFDKVIQKSTDFHNLAEDLLNGVFSEQVNVEHLKERKKLLNFFNISQIPSSFWEKYDAIKNQLEQLKILTGVTERERLEIIKIVKNLLETSENYDDWLPYLQIVFPELAFYLTGFPFSYQFLTEYFSHYVFSRIMDVPKKELLNMANKAAENKLLWQFPAREKLIEEMRKPEIPIVWVDAMGLEWIGFINGLLKNYSEINMEIKTGRANLPSTTEHNKNWIGKDELIRGLDKIAHEYDYSFPDSLLKQMVIIKEAIEKAVNLFKEYGEVLITSDHGLTRFASYGDKVSVPEGTEICKWGRYAVLPTDKEQHNFNQLCVCEENRVFLAAHGKFRGGSSTVGEVHGGATLEECLVPVIKLYKQKIASPVPINVKIDEPVVKLDVKGAGILKIELSETINNLSLRVRAKSYVGAKKQERQWEIILDGLKVGDYQGLLEYEHGLIQEIKFKLVKGIIQEDLGL
jgi:hypothetical protein